MNDKPNGLMFALPFPNSLLNPNRKAHWAVKNRAAQELKTACFYIVKDRGVELERDRRYEARIVFCPPNNRRRDEDNLLASYKAGLDGMCLALGIDDSQIHVIPDIGPVVGPHGKVEASIKEMGG